VPPLEAWEKVLIDWEALQEDMHRYLPCTTCHAGIDDADMETAHSGLIADPSADAVASCGRCHPNIAPFQSASLHNSLAGYDTVLYARSVPENHPAIEEGESYHCNSCHTTCGDCHVSQPDSVGGGLVEGHAFVRTPSMSRQCTACHGSRVKNEYTGAHEGIPADVHLRSARMICTDCHTGDEMHGVVQTTNGIQAGAAAHRYDGPQSPTCESCHADQVGVGSGNPYHEEHGTELLSCQVCHSVAYINCSTCHLERTAEDVPYFRLEDEEMGFYIGRNVLRNAERPYRYVPVRHVPTWPGLFDLYGENLLPNFDNLPTWTYATPHNIQRNTPQTASCESCHTNNAIFLTPDRVLPEEQAANAGVIVPAAPPLPEGYAPAATPQGGPAPTPTPDTGL